MVLRAVIGGLLSIILLLPSNAHAEKRVALIIGNGAYIRAPKLENPKNDAAAMEAMFKAAGFDTVVRVNDLGVGAMRRALRNFSDTSHDADIAVVFYAGHGMEVSGTNYLIPTDAVLEQDIDVQDEAVSLDRVNQILERVKRLRLVILDACRDNPFVRSMRRTIATRAVRSGYGEIDEKSLPPNTLIAYAQRAGATAEDGTGFNSPYTTALLKHLPTPGLDIELALRRVRDEVLRTTRNRQEPFKYGSLGGGEIALVPQAAPPPQPAPHLPSPALPTVVLPTPAPFPSVQPAVTSSQPIASDDEAAWSETQKADTLEAYSKYLREKRAGHYAQEARLAVVDLEEWARAEKENTRARYQAYLDFFQTGLRTAKARERIAAFDREADTKACQAVAQEAIKQAEESARNECGFRGQEWSTNRDVQVSWCLSLKTEERTTNAVQRKAALQRCDLQRKDETAWKTANTQNTLASLRRYLAERPSGAFADQARSKIGAIDENAWTEATAKWVVSSFERYLSDVPDGGHADAAKTAIKELKEWDQALKANSIDAYALFLKTWSQSRFAAEANTKSAELQRAAHEAEAKAFKTADAANDRSGFEAFLKQYPNGELAQEARNRLQALKTAQLRAACEAYAKDAVARAEEAAQEPCHFTGERWSTSTDTHVEWCIRASEGDRNREPTQRKEALDKCTAPRRDSEQWRQALLANSIDAVGRYLANWPEGQHVTDARLKLAQLCRQHWPSAQSARTWPELTMYAGGVCKDAGFAEVAHAQRDKLDDEAWKKAKASNTKAAYQTYLALTGRSQVASRFLLGPSADGKHASEAETQLNDFEAWTEANAEDTLTGYTTYIEAYPKGRFITNAKQKKDELESKERARDDADYDKAKRQDTSQAFTAYEEEHANGRHIEAAKKRREQLEELATATLDVRGELIRAIAAAVSPDARRLAAVYQDGSLVLWDARVGKLVTRAKGIRTKVKSELDRTNLAYSPDGRWLVVDYGTDEQGGINLLSADTGAVQRTFSQYGASGFAKGGRYLVLSQNNDTKVWDTQSGAFVRANLADELARDAEWPNDQLLSVALTDDGRIQLNGPSDGEHESALPATFELLDNGSWLVEDSNKRYAGSPDIHAHIGLSSADRWGEVAGRRSDKPKTVSDDYRRAYYRPNGLDLAVKKRSSSR